MSQGGLIDLIQSLGETRNQELKRSMNWNDENTKFKLTKSIMAMSNIRNGGVIILGVEERPDKTYDPVGMTASDFESFDFDDVADYVGNYVAPYVTFSLKRTEIANKKFIAISIREFDETPIICKKAYYIAGKCVLEIGAVCTRTRNTKPQSSKITSLLDIKELVDLAIEKGVRLYIERAPKAGLSITATSYAGDEEKFKEELSDFI